MHGAKTVHGFLSFHAKGQRNRLLARSACITPRPLVCGSVIYSLGTINNEYSYP